MQDVFAVVKSLSSVWCGYTRIGDECTSKSHSTRCVKKTPGIEEAAIVHFKEGGIRAIGCDTVTCDMAVVDGEGLSTTGHTSDWLSSGIFIMKMLTFLDSLSLRSLFVATPLKIKDSSGSPSGCSPYGED